LADPAVQARNLTKIFEKTEKPGKGLAKALHAKIHPTKERTAAVDHINFEIKGGEFFGLVGPNGAGKTTTIKLLCTLLVPDEGTALVNGFDVSKEAEKVRMSLGVVTGGERGLYWRLTGRENLWFFSQMYNISSHVAKPRIQQLLELVELQDRADEQVEKYSRGMKQRLHVIKGLVNDPPILLLDEPTLGLDPASARVIRDFVKEKLQKEQKKTILHTTHYMEEADQLCDRIAIIDHGKIIALDTPENLKKRIQQLEIAKIQVTQFKPTGQEGIESISHVRKVVVEYTDSTVGAAEITVHTENLDEVIPRLTEFLVKTGAKIVALQETKPSLEDVFIAMTGRRLRE